MKALVIDHVSCVLWHDLSRLKSALETNENTNSNSKIHRRTVGCRNAFDWSSSYTGPPKWNHARANRYQNWNTVQFNNPSLFDNTDFQCRTDKKQHFSEKVTKVESILAADGTKVEKKVTTV